MIDIITFFSCGRAADPAELVLDRVTTSWYFRGGQNDCNLLYLTTKHVFENFWGQLPGCPLVHETLHGSQQSLFIRVVPTKTDYKPGKKCDHPTRSSNDLQAALP